MTLAFGGLFGKRDDEGRRKDETYYSISPTAFTSFEPDIDDLNITGGRLQTTAGMVIIQAPVNLPHGALITSAIVYGNAGLSDETWSLGKDSVSSDSGITIATASVNTFANSAQSESDVDNLNFTYDISVSTPEAADILYSAVIIYNI